MLKVCLCEITQSIPDSTLFFAIISSVACIDARILVDNKIAKPILTLRVPTAPMCMEQRIAIVTIGLVIETISRFT